MSLELLTSLSTAEGSSAGRDVAEAGAANLGMRDAIMGLQWVQDNIAAFGGDPARVCLNRHSGDVERDELIRKGNSSRTVCWRGNSLFIIPQARLVLLPFIREYT